MKRLLPLLALSLAGGCAGADRSASESRQIATNLDGEGATEAMHLYWVQDGNVHQGRCTAMPHTVANCQADLRTLPFDAFSSALSAGVVASIDELTKRIETLTPAIPALAEQIADLSVQIGAANADVQTRAAAKAEAEAELATAKANAAALEEQIAALTAEINANPNNNDLKTLRNQRQSELSAENTKKAAADAKLAQAAQALASTTADRDAKVVKSANLSFEFAAKKADLASAKQQLVVAQGEKVAFDETMARLENASIVYDVKQGETLFTSIRPFVARFKAIFEGGATFATALTYDGLDLAVPTTGTVGTVDFPMELAASGKIADIAVQYRLTHTAPADLTISLVSPAGVVVQLRSGTSGSLDEFISADGRQEVGFNSRVVSFQSFNGVAAKGQWRLRIADNSNGDSGKLKFVRLLLKLKSGA